MNAFHDQNPQQDLPSAGETSIAQPLTASRIPSLDILRGIAVLFGLFMSIWIFGGFSRNAQTGLLVSSKGFDYRLFGTIDLLFEGKMRALIAIVFGAGMILFLSKQSQKGELPTHDLFIRRQMWLGIFGVINGLLFFWTHDVLFHLGIMGILLFPLFRLSIKGLMIVAVLFTIFYSGKYYWRYADDKSTYSKYVAVTNAEKKIETDSTSKAKALVAKGIKDSTTKKDTLTKKQVEEKGAWEGLVASLKHDQKKDDGEKKQMRKTSYGSIYEHSMGGLQVREAQWTYQFGIWDFGSMILLGMALFKLNFFTGRYRKSIYLLLGLAGITIGILLGWYRLHNQQYTLQDYAKYIDGHAFPHTIFFPFERAFAAVGYASLVIFFIHAGLFKIVWRAFAKVGRLALSNYLLQSIICTLFFTGFGTGYFARLTQLQLYLFVLQLCAVQIVLSAIWLRFYSIGPAEWLWHCLMYGKRLPIKKKNSSTAEPVLPTVF
jgi:uncharacterized protein